MKNREAKLLIKNPSLMTVKMFITLTGAEIKPVFSNSPIKRLAIVKGKNKIETFVSWFEVGLEVMIQDLLKSSIADSFAYWEQQKGGASLNEDKIAQLKAKFPVK